MRFPPLQQVLAQTFLAFAASFLFACELHAQSCGLIVIGMTGDESDAALYEKLATETQSALIQRGLTKENVTILRQKVNREMILTALSEAAVKTQAEDEFWLVLFGHSGVTANDQPAFQVRGPRLTAEDLKHSLAAIPAIKLVCIATDRSGAFLPFLTMEKATVLSATAEQGEVNQPRFPEQWVRALTENPKASFAEIAARSTELVTEQYASLGLLQGENARLLDPETGKILQPPFAEAQPAVPTAKTSADSKAPDITAAEIEIPESKPAKDFEVSPATEETRALIAEAAATANPDDHPALLLRQSVELTVNSDDSTEELTKLRIYLAREEALDEWANFSFPQSPPGLITTIEAASIILPDGSSVVLNPKKTNPGSADRESGFPSTTTLLIPQARAGAVIEIIYRTRRQAQNQQPEFYTEFTLRRSIPILKNTVTLKLPKSRPFEYRLQNDKTQATISETEHSKVYAWDFGSMPAFESLPFDPPLRTIVPWLGVSSMESWDDFIQWFRRISKDSDFISPAVEAKAAEIAEANPTREAKIRAAFEFVTSLRYVAIEFGINAFRPRTPDQVLHQRYGDCKDKANLLVALLRSMNIPANFVLINRGSTTEIEFPGWQFNHAIAYVPNEGTGGLWLDSTDPTTAFGTISPGNFGRSALVFSDDGAEFKTVAGTGVTTVQEEWNLDRDENGGIRGTLHQQWTGLADYQKRSELASLGPKQRVYLLTQQIGQQVPLADLTSIQVAQPADLATPMDLRAEFFSPSPALPSPSLPFLEAFGALERDRPVEINDGQPFRYEQIIRSKTALPSNQTNFDFDEAGVKLGLRYETVDGMPTRIATCEISNSLIHPEAYHTVRSALRQWQHLVTQ